MIFIILHFVATTQIIGMSATLSNIADLKTFLKAEVYSNNFRPVSTKFYFSDSDFIKYPLFPVGVLYSAHDI